MTKLRHSVLNGTSVTYHEKYQIGFADITTINNATDLTRWRLLDERGRQTWHYLSTDEEVRAWPQSLCDKHHLDLPLVGMHQSPPPPSTPVSLQHPIPLPNISLRNLA